MGSVWEDWAPGRFPWRPEAAVASQWTHCVGDVESWLAPGGDRVLGRSLPLWPSKALALGYGMARRGGAAGSPPSLRWDQEAPGPGRDLQGCSLGGAGR